MHEISRHHTSWVSAIHENIETYMYFVWQEAGAQAGGDGRVTWTMSPESDTVANVILGTRLPTASAAHDIAHVLARYRAAGVPATWFVFPDDEPRNLPEILVSMGLQEVSVSPGMAMLLTSLPEESDQIAGFHVKPVRSLQEVEIFSRIREMCFGLSPQLSTRFLRVFAKWMPGAGLPIQGYIGYLHGDPVAVASTYATGDTVGVYNVATLPTARGRGIGREMTRFPLVAARERGGMLGVLQASSSGYSVYRKLGFDDVLSIRLFRFG